MNTVFVMLLVLLTNSPAESAGPAPGYVSLCELVQHPEKYDRRTVITAGVIGPAWTIIDKACGVGTGTSDVDTSTWLEFVRVDDRSRAKDRLIELNDSEYFVFVVLEARFDAYRRYTGPLPADKHRQEILKAVNSRFGDNNCCRFRLAIQKVLLAEPVDESVPALRSGNWEQ